MTKKNSIEVLVPLHKDGRDVAGTLYPENGLILFSDYENDDSIFTGLSGYKIDEEKIYIFSQLFALVNIESYINILPNLIKFASGYVVCIGTKEKCLNKVKNNV